VVASFVGATVIGGMNFVGVKFTIAELDPFWGAAIRFGLAAFLLAWYAVLTKVPFPRGRALGGSIVFGLLGIGGAYAFAYYSLLGIPAGLLSVFVATAPLMTLLLARLHGLETLRPTSVVGALIVVAGVAILLAEQIAGQVSVRHLAAGLLMPLAIAESSVLLKKFPRVHPVALNTVGMGFGTGLLLLGAIILGERFAAPIQPRTIAAVLYLVVLGSIGLFTLFLFVIRRWSASATSYQTVLMPVVAVGLAAVLAGESVGWNFLAGGVVVLLGVYVAALRNRPVAAPAAPTPSSNSATESPGAAPQAAAEPAATEAAKAGDVAGAASRR
jgi:drug/metabolite transporter (DMT)-like permease